MQEDVYQGDGLNLYAYCHNNPVAYYDPSGYAAAGCGNAATRDPDDQTTNTRTEQTTQGNVEGGTPTNGYSNFANGMSPEDAARYIANNEKAFFNKFSERASAAGLGDTQIAEAFEAMRNGDYAKMANYFDTSSPVDGAVF